MDGPPPHTVPRPDRTEPREHHQERQDRQPEAREAKRDHVDRCVIVDEEQREAVRKRDVLAMIAAGGNIYYLAKLAGIFRLNVQDLGAQQTGLTLEAFKQKLLEAGR